MDSDRDSNSGEGETHRVGRPVWISVGILAILGPMIFAFTAYNAHQNKKEITELSAGISVTSLSLTEYYEWQGRSREDYVSIREIDAGGQLSFWRQVPPNTEAIINYDFSPGGFATRNSYQGTALVSKE